MSELLVLDPAARQLLLQVRRGEPLELSRSVAQAAPVVEHWARARALGAPSLAPAPDELLVRGSELAERTERLDPLLACGRRVLDRVAAAAACRDHVLLFADADGTVVHAEGGGGFGEHARRMRLFEGARWTESERGTNAIGTALELGRPVFVRGAAHYVESYQELVCYAAPVRDPDGQVVGVLDVTSFESNEDRSLGAGVMVAARALEEVLRLRAWSRAGDAINRAVARSLERMVCPVALIEPPGRVTRANGSARALFAHHEREDVRSWIGLDFAAAVAAARAGRSAHLAPGDGSGYQVRFEPIETEERLVALLAFFEPSPRAAARPTVPAVGFDGLFAEDPATREALAWAARVAPSEVPVMLLAETGAGKELVARGVHAASRRAAGPFVPVNCGAIEPSLLASELFGYAPGAFTGASTKGRAGYLSAADGGTLFLDEVADMPLAMQAALLRVLESGAYQRVGETELCTADVRVVCATCADLEQRVAEGRFRRDLFFRLKGAVVRIPPLRERSDLGGLAEHLLTELAAVHGIRVPRVGTAALAALLRHPWPGNVRELRTVLEVALVLAAGARTLEPSHLPPGFAGASSGGTPAALKSAPRQSAPTRAAAEAQALRRALDEHGGNLSGAARQLGVARSTLYRMLRRHGLHDAG